MSIEEKCAERFTEGTGGYLVCVDETRRHDATMETVGCITGCIAFLAFVGALVYILVKRA